jgi:maltooligosyltrehalose trehalohydrolase
MAMDRHRRARALRIPASVPEDSSTHMVRAGVWAPIAESVELAIGMKRVPMERGPDGWWRTAQAVLSPESDYAFIVDGRGPFPDPRSPWQPQGVHGPSRHLDHSVFAWTDRHWQARPLSSAIVYELHLGTFTPEGTCDAAIARLPHLCDLGITHVQLMPVAAFEGDRGWGYDGVAPFAPHEAYGGPDGLKRLVNACHAHGLGVILDVVYNHLGPTGNYLSQYGPYFSDRHPTPWGQGVNFDGPASQEVRQYFLDNARMWLRDYHIDGLRLDAIHAIIDLSAVHFLEELAASVEEWSASLGRHFVLIAESDLNDPRVVQPWEIGGYGIDAQWSDDIHHALHVVLTGEQLGYYADFSSIEDLAVSLRRPYVYAGHHSTVRGRPHGRPPVGMTGHRFVAYLQNHDQIGNRALGERICHLVSHQRAMLGTALILLSPYVPMLFQGEEWSASSPFQYFVDFEREPELALAVSEGRRRECAFSDIEVPDPNARSTFERSRLNWEELALSMHREMFEWHQKLIQFRRSHPSLTNGRLDQVHTRLDTEQEWLVVDRDPVVIAANFSGQRRQVPGVWSGYRAALESRPGTAVEPDSVSLPGETIAVLIR